MFVPLSLNNNGPQVDTPTITLPNILSAPPVKATEPTNLCGWVLEEGGKPSMYKGGKYAVALSKWDIRYLCQALFVSRWSSDPSTKVGCVISDSQDRPISSGLNGLPKFTFNLKEEDLPQESKRLMVVHAEVNAIQFAKEVPFGSNFYVTHHPCGPCMAVILQKNPKRVFYLDSCDQSKSLSANWDSSLAAARTLANHSSIQLIGVDREKIEAIFKEMVTL